MPTVVACPKCKKKYNLPDNMLGKAIQCQSCNARFKTQAPAKRSAQQNVESTKRQERAAASQKKSVEMARLGIDGPIQKSPELFGNATAAQFDPLANHVVVDPGFADVQAPEAQVDESAEVNEYSEMYSNPALAKRNLTSRVKVEYDESSNFVAENAFKGQPFYVQFWFMILVGFSLAFVILAIVGKNNIETGLSLINWVLGAYMLCNFAINCWGIKQIYDCTRSPLQVLLSLFVPFYILVVIVRHWSFMKYYTYAVIALIMVVPVAMIPIYILWIVTGMLEST